jgi:dTDP-4-amino-4,6-dideoxygalactose transaminase
MTDVEAAIGLVQLDLLPERVKRRRENAGMLNQLLGRVKGITSPLVHEDVEHSYHQYTVLIDPEIVGRSRDEFAEFLKGEGIGTGVHYPRPLHLQPGFDGIAEPVKLPVSEELANRVLSIPVHPGVEPDDVERIADAIRCAQGS